MRVGWYTSILVLGVVACGDDATAVSGGDSTESSGAHGATSSESSGDTADDGASSVADGTSSTGDTPVMPGDGPFGGGTRLHPVVEHGDGAARLLHWYDSELGIECEFARDAAGDLRCLPIRLPGVRVGYGDEACSEGVLQVESCGAAPAFVRGDAIGSVDCDTGPRQLTYRRGGPIAAPEDLWDWSANSGGCFGAGVPIGDHYAIDRVDDRDFLAAVFVDEQSDGALGVRSIVAEDGSWERAHTLDDATGLPCSQAPEIVDEQLVFRCRIGGVGKAGNAWAAADCSADPLVVVVDDGTCNAPPIASDGSGWWSLGAAYADEVYAVGDDECTTLEIDRDLQSVFERGAAVDPPTFADYVRTPVPGAGDERLQPYGVQIGGVPTMLTRIEHAWWDATLEASCTAVALPDGGLVCAHAMTDDPPEWGDPECTTTILARSFSDEVPPIVVRVEHDGCELVALDARAVFGVWEEPVYELDPKTEACTPIDAEGWTFLQLGNVVQLAQLPALVVETL